MRKEKRKVVDNRRSREAMNIASRKLRRVERNTEIRLIYQKGHHSMQDIADHYRLTKSCIWNIINHK